MVDLMEPKKLLGETGLVPYIQGSQKHYQVSNDGHFLAGTRTSGYNGDLEKKNELKYISLAGKV